MLVRLTIGQLVGTAWREAGTLVDIPSDRADHLIRKGHAQPADEAGPPPPPRPPVETAVRKNPPQKATKR